MAVNEIFQYSIISALMDGVASEGLPISELVSHGDHGLGTFRYMRGEMVMLDGKLYQMQSDNTVTPVDTSPASDAVAPFAMVTRFRPTVTFKAAFADKKALFAHLSSHFPDSRNFFLAIRIEGVFKGITVRTAAGQTKPGEGLMEVGKNQASHTFEEPVRGYVIGFRSPEYTMGISVAGDHMHFITEDRTQGGHILSFGTDGDVEISAAQISKWHVELPTNDPDFSKAKLEGDKEGIAAVEG
ncbi:alpha-acetolactate decarboxylase [Colletotrichum graminicola]|uniref:Alpha-acetolactate decarboxylase n=1 Tax=Colletotrichum graminicola (strain M1.001 / M2 / FGSC 10212) TaxID=645133 RepID=E3QG74_COLGM|nr:alpha-acetolactate decarboxylase [Colletotrichum graminicola M1.001]EFQ29670.1 alpha-acetolactate decarboxylase [Colletotrichum graminicola M1.001]WDK12582.1 alpha-acetolactate decarboxylase [Colletotrichum graminicola]